MLIAPSPPEEMVDQHRHILPQVARVVLLLPLHHQAVRAVTLPLLHHHQAAQADPVDQVVTQPLD
jgi:hypothetical protein